VLGTAARTRPPDRSISPLCEGHDVLGVPRRVGNSRSAAGPILAGLSPAYFKKAIGITRRASACRRDGAVRQAVKLLGVDEVAAFFAAQRREATPVRADRNAVDRGRAASAVRGLPRRRRSGRRGRSEQARAGHCRTAGHVTSRNQLLLFKADKRSPGDEPLTKMKAILKAVPTRRRRSGAYYSSLR
jgi:hypothetical protein